MKNANIKTSLLVACLLTVGCTMDGGEVAQKDLSKTITCKDTRDGEMFSFNTDTITNIRRGVGAPTSFDMTTNDGKQITLSSDMEAWLKCVNRGQQRNGQVAGAIK